MKLSFIPPILMHDEVEGRVVVQDRGQVMSVSGYHEASNNVHYSKSEQLHWEFVTLPHGKSFVSDIFTCDVINKY